MDQERLKQLNFPTAKLQTLIDEYRSTRNKLRITRNAFYENIENYFLSEPRLKRFLSIQQQTYIFCLAIWYLISMSMIIIHYPDVWKYFYVGTLLILFPIRYYQYNQLKMTAFCYDFCYFVNAMTAAALFFPQYTVLVRLAQPFTAITLSASIAWQNKLVFHSIDKLTSVFIHLSPSLSLFIFNVLCTHDKNLYPQCDFSLFTHFVQPMLFYLTWQFLYAFIIDFLNGDIFASDHTVQSSVHYFSQHVDEFRLAQYVQQFARDIHWFRRDQCLDGNTWKTKFLFYFVQLFYTLLFFPLGWLQYYFPVLGLFLLLFCFNFVLYEGSSFYLSTTYIKDRVHGMLSQQSISSHQPTGDSVHDDGSPVITNGDSNNQEKESGDDNNNNNIIKIGKNINNILHNNKMDDLRQRRHLQDIHDTLHQYLDPKTLQPPPPPQSQGNNIVTEKTEKQQDESSTTDKSTTDKQQQQPPSPKHQSISPPPPPKFPFRQLNPNQDDKKLDIEHSLTYTPPRPNNRKLPNKKYTGEDNYIPIIRDNDKNNLSIQVDGDTSVDPPDSPFTAWTKTAKKSTKDNSMNEMQLKYHFKVETTDDDVLKP